MHRDVRQWVGDDACPGLFYLDPERFQYVVEDGIRVDQLLRGMLGQRGDLRIRQEVPNQSFHSLGSLDGVLDEALCITVERLVIPALKQLAVRRDHPERLA